MELEKQKVINAICRLCKRKNGQAICIGSVILETKINEGRCRCIMEELAEMGLITRVVTVDMNNHKRYCYKSINFVCENIINA